jgi:hypothetical protein
MSDMGELYWGHSQKPVTMHGTKSRTERVSTYVEYELVQFLEEYRDRLGMRSVSEALRRLAILGAQAEGYNFDVDMKASVLP